MQVARTPTAVSSPVAPNPIPSEVPIPEPEVVEDNVLPDDDGLTIALSL